MSSNISTHTIPADLVTALIDDYHDGGFLLARHFPRQAGLGLGTPVDRHALVGAAIADGLHHAIHGRYTPSSGRKTPGAVPSTLESFEVVPDKAGNLTITRIAPLMYAVPAVHVELTDGSAFALDDPVMFVCDEIFNHESVAALASLNRSIGISSTTEQWALALMQPAGHRRSLSGQAHLIPMSAWPSVVSMIEAGTPINIALRTA